MRGATHAESHCDCRHAEFTFVPQGDATLITWAMYGPAPFMSKMMQVFINMDTMIGNDFETGLASLKKLTEK